MLPPKQSQALQGQLRLHQEPGGLEVRRQALHSSCVNFGQVTISLGLSVLICEVEPMLQSFGTG